MLWNFLFSYVNHIVMQAMPCFTYLKNKKLPKCFNQSESLLTLDQYCVTDKA